MKRILALAFVASSSFLAFSIDQNEPIGWASVNANGQNGTTGGAGGNVVTANNMADLVMFSLDTQPLIIEIPHMITITPKGRYINVNSNKTIIGTRPGAGISQGGFRVTNNQKNIIFQNLTIQDTFVEGDWPGVTQDWDGIQIRGAAHHIWIHKCTFLRQGDGAIDIIHGADYITISYSKFGANNKVSLIGNSDTDPFTDRYKVTMHHNWFDRTTQRHPRVRFGWVHLFNNYYYDMGGYGRDMGFAISSGYGIGIGVNSQIWSEHNFFEKCVHPSQFMDNAANQGFLIDNGSHFVQSGVIQTRPGGITWNPADFYDYTLDPAENVKEIVMQNAGAEQAPTFVTNFDFMVNFDLVNFPNPFKEFTNVVFSLPENGNVRICLFDMTGRRVREVSNSYFFKGKNEILLHRGDLKNGFYLLTLEFNNARTTRKIAIL